MKYRISQYAQALHTALDGKKKTEQHAIARRFAGVLIRRRMIAKSHLILAAYEKLVLCARGERKVRIESAGPVPEQLKKEIRGVLDAKIHFEELVNPELLAGAKILVDDELLIDASAKKQIERMFTQKK